MKTFLRCLLLLIFAVAHKSHAQEPTDEIPEPKIYYGVASYYADKFEGRKTANGDIYNARNLTAACNILPLNTWIKVTNLRNNKTVLVRTNDRLHPKMRRIVDLSKAAALILGYTKIGLTRVKIEVLGKKKPPG